jgi:outer membrane protein assembly factor BamD (BamD/ComL family)
VNSTRILPTLIATLALLASSCASGRPSGVPPRYDTEDVPPAILEARGELADGETEDAMWRMRIASEAKGLTPETRAEVQTTLERAAEARIAQLSAPGSDPDDLEEMLDFDLPRQIAVTAGMRAAELLFEETERKKAYRMIKRLDNQYPHHHERPAAGALLAKIGFDFAADPGHYGIFFSFRGLAPEVLEYLVLNYPTEPSGDRAYWTLAEIYEENREFDLAIEKHQDLALWYPGSDYVPASEARIPHLRLAALGSPEYDRRELERTRAELEQWLSERPRNDLRPSVEVDLVDCIQRMADSDLLLARFYDKVKNPEGAEYHARRAIQEAQDGGNEAQAAEAEQLLANIRSKNESSTP